ncbi:MAG: hypothetical protein JHC85_08690 [Chthoniobacterales bacterium]|nr:hypothetical protein [Chthoniobacterales bacterium]
MTSNTEPSELIRRYIDGTVTPQEMNALQHSLREDPAFRRLFARYASLDSALGGGRLAAARLPVPATQPLTQSPFKWLSWRPLIAAAAGLVFGMFCTSVVFAYAKPKSPAAAPKPLPLADPDFEISAQIPALGIPAKAGAWGGDFSRVVTAENGITPKHGRHMLRILRSDNELSAGTERSYVGEVAQVIDLRPLRAQLSGANPLVEVSAQFNAVTLPPGGKHEFAVKAAAFRGDIADAPRLWEDHDAGGSRSNRSVEADSDTGTWQRVATPLVVPPDADFLVIECAVVFKGPLRETGATQFFGHYVDQVEVRLSGSSRPWMDTQNGD